MGRAREPQPHPLAARPVEVSSDSPRKAQRARSLAGESEPSRFDSAARIAAGQHGVATRRQLRAGGIPDAGIDYRLSIGRLHRLYRGVYLVGHAVPPPLAIETAALLACGPGAVLSHRTAGWIWEMLDRCEDAVDVTVVERARASRPGLRLHRTRDLPRSQVRIRNGLPVTDPERTLIDLAGVVSAKDLAAAFDATAARRRLRRGQLVARLEGSSRRGTRALRALLQVPGFSRSTAERRMRALIERAGLPMPRRNVRVAGHEVDFLWAEQRLVVEVDGFEHHGDREAFERDRRRDAQLVAAGFRVLRITWRQLTQEREAVVARLAQALCSPLAPG